MAEDVYGHVAAWIALTASNHRITAKAGVIKRKPRIQSSAFRRRMREREVGLLFAGSVGGV